MLILGARVLWVLWDEKLTDEYTLAASTLNITLRLPVDPVMFWWRIAVDVEKACHVPVIHLLTGRDYYQSRPD